MSRLGHLIVTILLCSTSCSSQGTRADDRIEKGTTTPASASTLAQAGKIYELVTAIVGEYERAFADANFPEDAARQNASRWLKKQQLDYQIVSIDYQQVLSRSTVGAVSNFLIRSRSAVEIPTGTFSTWEYPKGRSSFSNLAKIETLYDDYYVLAIGLAKDLASETAPREAGTR